MTALNKQALRYGDNVLWFLNELAAYDASDIDGGEFDVYGEDRNGLEGCSTIDVTELAADAAKLIEAAENRIAELEAEKETLRPVGVMSEKAFHRLENSESRFIALWPRPGIYLPRKRPDDGVIVYARTAAGIGVKGE